MVLDEQHLLVMVNTNIISEEFVMVIEAYIS
jgi:hypothetical protein